GVAGREAPRRAHRARATTRSEFRTRGPSFPARVPARRDRADYRRARAALAGGGGRAPPPGGSGPFVSWGSRAEEPESGRQRRRGGRSWGARERGGGQGCRLRGAPISARCDSNGATAARRGARGGYARRWGAPITDRRASCAGDDAESRWGDAP